MMTEKLLSFALFDDYRAQTLFRPDLRSLRLKEQAQVRQSRPSVVLDSPRLEVGSVTAAGRTRAAAETLWTAQVVATTQSGGSQPTAR